MKTIGKRSSRAVVTLAMMTVMVLAGLVALVMATARTRRR